MQDERTGLLFLDARINGRPARLLLDTGAAVSVMNARLLDITAWDLKASRFSDAGPEVRMFSVYTREAVWAQAAITLSSLKTRSLRVVAMDMEMFARSLGRRVDGVLGQDFLTSFGHLIIDHKQRKLSLYP